MTDSAGIVIATILVGILIGVVGLWFGYNPGWNHGKNPTEDHPNATINGEFDPRYTMLFYMDWRDSFGSTQDILRVLAIKLQFPAIGRGTPANNTWESNQQTVADWINRLNAGTVPVHKPEDSLYVTHGVRNFNFNQPHHVVIYIKNRDIGYNFTYPVWFSDVLVNSAPTTPPKKAAKNWSFFGAKVVAPMKADGITPAIEGPYSKQVIYMKNFFRGDGVGYPELKEPQNYSLKINAMANVTDLSGVPADPNTQSLANLLPFIIDPDTGNMGGGDPPRI